MPLIPLVVALIFAGPVGGGSASLAATARVPSDRQQDQKLDEREERAVGVAVQLIATCPAWSQLGYGDRVRRGEVRAHLARIARYPIELLREAVSRYERQR